MKMAVKFDQLNPYVGLRPFDREDSFYFFGRRQQSIELLERLHETRFLAVVGSSGCGKSSLIRAGLIPSLLGGFLVEDRDQWRIAVMRPGGSPLRNLAAAFCVDDGSSPKAEQVESLLKGIAEDHTGAVVKYLTSQLGSDTNLLLLVDQFEEVFAFRGTDDDDQLSELNAERGPRTSSISFWDLPPTPTCPSTQCSR